MKSTAKVRKSLLLAICILTLSSCLAIGGHFSLNSVSAFAEEGPMTENESNSLLSENFIDEEISPSIASTTELFMDSTLLALCKDMTDTDYIGTINGVRYTVEKYFAAQDLDSAAETELVYGMIPKEMFFNEGQWFYDGVEYSFYIYTYETNSLYSEMVVVDKSYLLPGVRSVKQGDGTIKEQFVSESSMKLKMYTRRMETRPSVWNDKIYTSTIPSVMLNQYSLSNLQFFTFMENENGLNPGDYGYKKFTRNPQNNELEYTDKGVVLSQTRLNYAGARKQYKGVSAEQTALNIINLALSFIPGGQLPEALAGAINLALTSIDVAQTVGEVLEGVVDDEHVEHDNESNIVPYVDKSRQAELPGEYARCGGYEFVDQDISINDYVEFITKYSESNAVMHISMGISFNIIIQNMSKPPLYVTKNGVVSTPDNDSRFLHAYEGVIFDDVNTYVGIGENAGYLLRDESEQIFEFTPKRKGEYRFSVDSGKTLEVSSDRLNWNDKSVTYVVELEESKPENPNAGGKPVYIRVSHGANSMGRTFNLNIEYVPRIINTQSSVHVYTVKDNSEQFVFTPTISGIYILNCDNKNIRQIVSIGSEIVPSVLENGGIEECFYLEKGKMYCIELETNSENKEYVWFSVEDGKVLQGGNECLRWIYEYYVFTFVPQEDGDYTFESDAPAGTVLRYTTNADYLNYANRGEMIVFEDTMKNLKKGVPCYIYVDLNSAKPFLLTCGITEYVESYSVQAAIYYNDTIYLMYYDSKGNYVYDPSIYTSISYFYIYNDQEYSLPWMSVSHLAYGVEVGAYVLFADGHTQKATCTYSGTTYTMWNTINMTGLTKVTIDARNSSSSGNMTLTVPSNVQTLNLLGAKNRVYQSFNIVTESRTTELVINLYDFNFSATGSNTIKSSSGEITINVMAEECKINNAHYGLPTISASTMNFNKGVLRVYGTGQVASSTNRYCDRAIVLTSLYVNGGQLYAYGGSGINSASDNGTGYKGAHGAEGLMASYVFMNGDGELFCYGGNGGDGGSGAAGKKGGAGGRGGDGSYITLRISGNKSRVHLIGGDGGNGGNGGSGATGGAGGYRGSANSVAIDLTGVDAQNGDYGTDGRNG